MTQDTYTISIVLVSCNTDIFQLQLTQPYNQAICKKKLNVMQLLKCLVSCSKYS